MNTEALIRLAANARAYAKAYVALTEALIAEGVDESTARDEARWTATLIATSADDDGPRCPLCGGPAGG